MLLYRYFDFISVVLVFLLPCKSKIHLGIQYPYATASHFAAVVLLGKLVGFPTV